MFQPLKYLEIFFGYENISGTSGLKKYCLQIFCRLQIFLAL